MIDMVFLLLLSAGAVLFEHGKKSLKHFKYRPMLHIFLAALLSLLLVFLTAVVIRSVSTPTRFLIQISFLAIVIQAAYKHSRAYFTKATINNRVYLFKAVGASTALMWVFVIVFIINEAFTLRQKCSVLASPTPCYTLMHLSLAKISLFFLGILVLLIIADTWVFKTEFRPE